jgi:hypothetical protein
VRVRRPTRPLADLNKRLKRGQYFFLDIVRDGVALYEAPGHPLERPKKLKPAEALKEAQRYFDEWFPSAEYARKLAGYSFADDQPKFAAFNLHQATERLYHCTLLVLTLYSPLCRARHNGLYAEREAMPITANDPLSGKALSMICSA